MDSSAWTRLRKVAQRQSGVFTLDQAMAAGFPPSTLFDLTNRGQLVRVDPTVYAMATTPLTPTARETAGLLRLGPSSVLSHLTAAAVVKLVPQPVVPWLTIPITHRPPPRSDGLIVKRSRLVESLPLGGGRRITPLPRTLVDIAQCLNDRELAATYLTAMQREPDIVEAVAATLNRLGRGYPGVARGRRVLDEFSPEMESILGAEGYAVLKPHYPTLTAGWTVMCIDGVERTCDLGIPELGVDFECDSWSFHGSLEQQTANKRRDRIMAASGVQTTRLNTDDIRRTPEATLVEVAAVVARRRRDLAA